VSVPYFEDSFSQPASPSKFRPADYQGNLILVWPTEYRTGIKTDYGDSDAVAARVVVLDGPAGVEEHDNVLFFQGALISTLKPSVGTNKPVLGRLGRGTSKPGQSAPFILTVVAVPLDPNMAIYGFPRTGTVLPVQEADDTPTSM
jgi:hypothetical protein